MRIAFVTLTVALVGIGVSHSLIRKKVADPIYAGKRLSQWIKELNSPVPGASAAATDAVKAIGTSAIPQLLIEASAHDSAPKAIANALIEKQSFFKLHIVSASDHQSRALRGLCALGTNGASAVAQGLTNSDKWIRHGCVGQWEMCTYYPDIVFDPLFSRLKDSEPIVRARTANALGMLHQQPERVVPVLIELLRDRDDWVRCMAALGLNLYGDAAKPAVPALLQSLTNSGSAFRSFATDALKRLDPQAAAKAGIR
jgi:hypothetical protein